MFLPVFLGTKNILIFFKSRRESVSERHMSGNGWFIQLTGRKKSSEIFPESAGL